jgi:hypothetical protein
VKLLKSEEFFFFVWPDLRMRLLPSLLMPTPGAFCYSMPSTLTLIQVFIHPSFISEINILVNTMATA